MMKKGNRDWTGRPEVLEVITLLASANRSELGSRLSFFAPGAVWHQAQSLGSQRH